MLSGVRLFAAPCAVARQASLSMVFLQVRILEWVAISFSRTQDGMGSDSQQPP